MSPEIRQLIASSHYDEASVRALVGLLPAEDAALDQLLDEVVAQHDSKAFTFLTLAALAAERRVDCRHLAGGAMLLPNYTTLGCVAWKMQGELPEALLEAVQNTCFPQEETACALVMMASWCQQHRGGVMPVGLSATARRWARLELRDLTWSLLRVVGWMTKDASLNTLIKERRGEISKGKVQQIADIYMEACRCPIYQ